MIAEGGTGMVVAKYD